MMTAAAYAPKTVDAAISEQYAEHPRIVNVQALRGVAVLLVVLLHWHNLEHAYRSDGALPVWLRIGHSGVDIFFVISGFIMVVISGRYAAHAAGAGAFLYQRWARIYPVYWFWFLVSLPFYLIVPDWLQLQAGQLGYFVESFFLIPTWTAQLVPVSWTLKYELYFYLVFALVVLLPQGARGWALTVWAVAMLIGQSICYGAPNKLCGNTLFLTMHPLAFEFVFGAVVGAVYLRGHQLRAWPLVLAGSLLVSGGWVVYLQSGIDLDDNLWYRVILFGLPAAVWLLGWVELERRHACVAPRWLLAIGNASYSIYLSHLLLLQLSYATLTPIAVLPTVFLSAIAGSFALVGGFLAYWWVERPLLRGLRGPLPWAPKVRTSAFVRSGP